MGDTVKVVIEVDEVEGASSTKDLLVPASVSGCKRCRRPLFESVSLTFPEALGGPEKDW